MRFIPPDINTINVLCFDLCFLVAVKNNVCFIAVSHCQSKFFTATILMFNLRFDYQPITD